MTNTTDVAAPRPALCPLARDQDGNIIELPPTAVAWRVRRQTGGRPRIVLGVDKQPMQLPLGYTIVDLEDILAPGAYRLDIVDGRGEPAGLTIDVSIGQPRNADVGEEPGDEAQPALVVPSLPATGSEMRLVLEANVRSTQMAFVHNQRTLELGMRMAETLRDSVRAMADSQADWIKSMAAARGFFRNATPQLPPPPPAEKPAEDEGEEDEDDDVPATPAWLEAVTPIVGIVTQQIVQAVMGFGKAPKPAANNETKLELADVLDWRRAAAKHEAAAAPSPAPPPLDLQSLIAKLPASLIPKLMQVRAMLAPEEQQRVLRLVSFLEPEMIEALAAQAETMSPGELADYLRARLAKPAA
jgi:hypothetical protein